MTDESPPIREVYDRIGLHFSQTRQYPWTDVTDFLDTVSGTVGLDVGCGNGRHTEAMASVVETPIGLDLSRSLLEEARSRVTESGIEATFLQGTATTVPLRHSTVDVAVYIAAIHHLREQDARIESLDELARVLRPGGVGLVSSWCTAHDRFDRETGFDTTIDWTLPDGETVPRYYHIYDREEFVADVWASDLELEREWVSKGNCYARVGGSR
ncbi:class I SAM-dependent methyltransferase [Halodesulfurarchaeum sp. HSR-GB]|uniref:class I SAM-dependent methyltransferase n=1 Tax=Halodesulfurarchaeum sp. HSR-GB TaxID=3074077 RepID=UPI0028597454|nr:class I SAM-dependent methyltransferase [Halodesulfurarchaeum sp. HSR-GB]MDR5657439.1 class I SAM-dependent methyltransferase [Halodesulfurarchaeum sp. HSR-GB]